MSAEELRRQVAWTVEDPSPARRAGRVLSGVAHLVSTVVTFGADAAIGARRPGWTVPRGPDDYLDLGSLTLRMPGSGPAEPVQATRTGVWATPAGRPPRRLPVEAWRVVEAVPGTGSGRPRHPEAEWRLVLSDGSTRGSLTGAWLALAWIGHLAGWSEPVAAPGHG
ncbi:hypothetical protein [Modestobacter sp. VKM Ac-2984]|uniref:hypothetical protein n=1 Tax=Modestobacter sp. VKM Ac-2984 TaxID=3004138 RepID=UPI0022AA15D7|nr:hypothetical protein [Modestobacter sp. VKM Ac-2984]MCZ2815676.1 hypothetical protein [Modestobacter sp. VKM Ac-2984]